MNSHENYIKRCIQLAQNGLGTTYPNPLVGSVIVHNNKIIGEGWHQKSGAPHAEVNAINSVKDKSLLSEATIYVSLEPCCHFGKTPPCTDLILHYNIPNIVIGTLDSNEKVAGRGVQKLKDTGKNVIVGVLEKECLALNKRFFTFHNKKRPYVILKWAETQDGFIAPETRNIKKPVWITNTYSRQIVHKWRSEEQGILVGTTTVLEDNPQLNVRDWSGNSPQKIVIDIQNKIPEIYHIRDKESEAFFITSEEIEAIDQQPIFENSIFDNQLPGLIMNILHKKNIQSVLIEGGFKTLQSFIDSNFWDEARVFKGKALFKKGTPAPILQGNLISQNQLIDDQLLIYENYD